MISPHLDDAVLSLGASIRSATRRGVHVDVLTVLAGDPFSDAPADSSGRRAGFATAAQATEVRREEDRNACRRVGARPLWLDLCDLQGSKPTPDAIAACVGPALEGYDAVLVPGGPLAHPDHLVVSRTTIKVVAAGVAVGFYVEQPYASWDALSRSREPRRGTSPTAALDAIGVSVDPGLLRRRHAGRPQDWLVKSRAIADYTSQLRVLRRGARTRIFLYEACHRGEGVTWVTLN